MKKIIKLFLIFLAIFCVPTYIFAVDEEDEENIDYAWIEQITKEAQNESEISVLSKNAVIYDRTSKTIIWGKNENERVPMASTTKIMTAIILLENANLDETVETAKESAQVGGSTLGLKTGDKITYNDLLYGLLLRSGNDAAVQIAISIAGSVDEFANLMNNKAKQLGLENTHFVTPHGLDEDEHYTTAYELAVMADYALNIEKFAEVVNTKTYTVNINGYPKTITNTNELLGYLNGVNGVKTGFTNKAGRCLVTSVSRNNFNIITVVLGADTKKIRTSDSIKLIEYAYSNYSLVDLSDIIEDNFSKWSDINKKRIYIYKGTEDTLKLALGTYKYTVYPIKNEYIDKISTDINSVKFLEAPIIENTKIGEINVYVNTMKVESIDILVKEGIYRKSIVDYVKENLALIGGRK